MNKTYAYKCIDQSILTPAFRDYVAAPILKYVPIGIHPNLITVISFFFSLAGLGVAYYFEPGFVTSLLVSLFIFLYLLLDHLDGMQAKRRGGGVPLGEWMDHFLDVLVNGVVMFTLVAMFEITDPIIQITIFSCSYIAQAVVFLEQRESGILQFGKIESFEAVLVLCVLFILSGFEIVRGFLMGTEVYGFRLIDWLLGISSVSGLRVILDSYRRIGTKLWPLVILLLTIAMMIAFKDITLGHTNIAYFIVMAGVFFNQEYLIGHLTGRRNLFLSLLPIISFLIFSMTEIEPNLIYLIGGAIVLIRFILTVLTLMKYKPEAES